MTPREELELIAAEIEVLKRKHWVLKAEDADFDTLAARVRALPAGGAGEALAALAALADADGEVSVSVYAYGKAHEQWDVETDAGNSGRGPTLAAAVLAAARAGDAGGA